MSGQIGSHQQGAFSTPTNGQPTDASVVLSNDNANRTTTNAHDADATIHIQSSVLASRPAAGTAQRIWITSDGLRFYFDSGSVWNELDYLSKTAGGTVAGAVTLSASLTAAAASFSGAVTMSATLSVPTIQGTAATLTVIGGASGTTIANAANNAANLAITDAGAATFRNTVTISAGGLTVSSGTTAVQALTATSVTVDNGVTSIATVNGSDNASLRLAKSGTVEWKIGFNQIGTGEKLEIVDSAGSVLLQVAQAGAVTVKNGLAVTTGGITISAGGLAVTAGTTAVQALTATNATVGIVNSSSGTTASLANGAGTTVLGPTTSGVYLLVTKNSTSNAHYAHAIVTYDATSAATTLSSLAAASITLGLSGTSVTLTNATGSTNTFSYAYLRLA